MFSTCLNVTGPDGGPILQLLHILCQTLWNLHMLNILMFLNILISPLSQICPLV